MTKKAELPFEEYFLYGPVMDQREGRRKVFLVHTKTKRRKTLTLARYRMCVYLGRVLDRSEEVDHVDEDRLNDALENLQILTRAENSRKSNVLKGRKFVTLRCPGCGKLFEREKRQTHLQKRARFTACSRNCSGKFGAMIGHHGETEKIRAAMADNVVEEFQMMQGREADISPAS